MFDALRFYKDYRIDHLTEGDKHCTDGWVQVRACPFCGTKKYHLGYSLIGGYYHCWNCGGSGKVIWRVIQEQLKCPESRAKELFYEYGGATGHRKYKKKFEGKAAELVLPHGTGELQPRTLRYLAKRGIDPLQAQIWGMQQTGPAGPYAHRILVPIKLNYTMVSFQARDFTGKAKAPYMACDMEKEVVHHKNIVLGADLVPGRVCAVVEGVFDAAKLGVGAVSTFGVRLKQEQVRFLAKRWDRFVIVFDNDWAGKMGAETLKYELGAFGREVEVVPLKDFGVKDPGELTPEQAKRLMWETRVR